MKGIQLTKSDREFARRYGLTNREMFDFIEDQIREEEMMQSFYRMKEKEEREDRNSPQAFYPAW